MNGQSSQETLVASQSGRRMVYGLNVLLSVLMVVAIVVLVNWIGRRHYHRVHLNAGGYSLSQQSRAVLGDLKGDFKIVTLFDSVKQAEDARDLIDEYDRYSDRITAEHLNPGRHVVRLEKLLATLRERFADELKPRRDAIDSGLASVKQMMGAKATLLAPLEKARTAAAAADNRSQKIVEQLTQFFSRFDDDLKTLLDWSTQQAEQTMPAYADMQTQLQQEIDRKNKQLAAVAQAVRELVAAPVLPGDVKESLLALNEQCQKLQGELKQTLTKLDAAPAVKAYDSLQRRLTDASAASNLVLIISPKRVEVLSLIGDLFQEPTTAELSQGNEPELRFQGEERITGSLISLKMEQVPLVVFVTTQGSAFAAENPMQSYAYLRQRLERMGFEVQQWNPLPRPNPMTGQMMPAAAAPTPKPGQRAVWVVLAPDAPTNQQAMFGSVMGGQQIASLLDARLKAGDGVLLMAGYQPASPFGGGNPIAPIVESYSIRPKLEEFILRESRVDERQTRADPYHEVEQWSPSTPITHPLAGTRGVVVQPSPLELLPNDKVKTWPLIELKGSSLWTESDPNVQQPKRDPARSKPSYIVAAAAEKEQSRLVVVTDKYWASDYISRIAEMAQNEKVAVIGARFPGNVEFFVNSVCWLGRLESLIAQSARTQDIRRIGQVTPARRNAVMWTLLLGMPALTVAAGVGVWTMRRRG